MLGVPHKSQHRFICWDHSVAAASASSFAYAASISCFFNAWRSSQIPAQIHLLGSFRCCSFGVFFCVCSKHLLFLQCLAFLTPGSGCLYFHTTSLSLVTQLLGTFLVCLLLMDVFHKNTLVLEYITFDFQIELMVKMLVDFLGLPVFLQ